MKYLKNEKQIFELGNHERFVLGTRVCYRMLCDRDSEREGYRIEISRGEETESCYLGEDFLSIVVLFAELIRGEVLPYSLPEIAEDFLSGEKIYQDKSE